jgi:hypothetical protein
MVERDSRGSTVTQALPTARRTQSRLDLALEGVELVEDRLVPTLVALIGVEFGAELVTSGKGKAKDPNVRVAEGTGYSAYWIVHLAKRYNAEGLAVCTIASTHRSATLFHWRL